MLVVQDVSSVSCMLAFYFILMQTSILLWKLLPTHDEGQSSKHNGYVQIQGQHVLKDPT